MSSRPKRAAASKAQTKWNEFGETKDIEEPAKASKRLKFDDDVKMHLIQSSESDQSNDDMKLGAGNSEFDGYDDDFESDQDNEDMELDAENSDFDGHDDDFEDNDGDYLDDFDFDNYDNAGPEEPTFDSGNNFVNQPDGEMELEDFCTQAVVEVFNLNGAFTEHDPDQSNDVLIGLEHMDLEVELAGNVISGDTNVINAFELKASTETDDYNLTLLNLMNFNDAVMKDKCQRSKRSLIKELPTAEADDIPHFLYDILWWPKRKPTFKQFIKLFEYVGIGVFTRPFDHFLLTRIYQKCLKQIEQLNCQDKKFDTLMKMFEEDGKALLIRVKTNSRQASTCFEFGCINAIGLKNLTNKDRGQAIANPLDFSEQMIIDSACALLLEIYETLCTNFDKIHFAESIVEFGNISFEPINLEKLKDYCFPNFGDCKWTKTIIEASIKSDELKNQLAENYSLLCASTISYRKFATKEDQVKYHRERACRKFENFYTKVFKGFNFYCKMSVFEKKILRYLVKRNSKARVKKLEIDDPDYLARKRKAKQLSRKRYRNSAIGRAAKRRENRSVAGKARKRRYALTPAGRATQKRANQTASYKASKKLFYQSAKGRAAQKRHRQTDSCKASKRRYNQTPQGKATFTRANFKNRHANKKVEVAIGPKQIKAKCYECKEKFKSLAVRVKFSGHFFHASCLTKWKYFNLNTQAFTDWEGTELLSTYEKNLIIQTLESFQN